MLETTDSDGGASHTRHDEILPIDGTLDNSEKRTLASLNVIVDSIGLGIGLTWSDYRRDHRFVEGSCSYLAGIS